MSDLISRAWEYILWLTGPRPGPARYQSGTPATKQGLVVCMSLLADESKTNSQHHSTLLSRLPLEVRRMIYDEILPSERLLWVRAVKAGDRKTGSLTEETVTTELFEHYPVASSAVDAVNSGNFGCGHEDWEAFWRYLDRGTLSFIDWDSIALMLSCKRVYLELFPLWTFCFNCLDDLEAFASCTAALGSGLPPIRTVRFSPALPPCFTVSPACRSEVDLRQEHAPIPCQQHLEWWAAEVQRLSQAVRQLPRLATLSLDLGVADQAELLESLTVIESVPAGTTLDAPPPPLPSGGLRVRWRRTRERKAGTDDLITSTDCRFVINSELELALDHFVINSELEWDLDQAMAELELLPPDTETARLYT